MATTTDQQQCTACSQTTSDPDGGGWRPFIRPDGSTGHMCGTCYSGADLPALRGYRWVTTAPSTPEQPTAPGRRIHIVVPDAVCALCGVAVDPGLSPRVAFTVGRTTVSGQRCAACDSGVRAHGYDALAYVDGKLGRDAEPDDFYFTLVGWTQREGLRPPPPAAKSWAF